MGPSCVRSLNIGEWEGQRKYGPVSSPPPAFFKFEVGVCSNNTVQAYLSYFMQWNAVYSLKKIVSVSGKLLVDDLTILKKKGSPKN